MKTLIPIIAASICAAAVPAGCASSDPAGLSRTTAEEVDAAPQVSIEQADAGDPATDAAGAGGAPAPPDNTGELTLPRCGSPPYQTVTVRARDIQAPPGREQAGVVVTLKHCPGQKFMTGADGRATILVTQGAETWVCFEAAGLFALDDGRVRDRTGGAGGRSGGHAGAQEPGRHRGPRLSPREPDAVRAGADRARHRQRSLPRARRGGAGGDPGFPAPRSFTGPPAATAATRRRSAPAPKGWRS